MQTQGKDELSQIKQILHVHPVFYIKYENFYVFNLQFLNLAKFQKARGICRQSPSVS